MNLFDGKGPVRVAVMVASGTAGMILSQKMVTSKFEAGSTFLGLPMSSEDGTVGWDDVVDFGSGLTAAFLGNALYSKFTGK